MIMKSSFVKFNGSLIGGGNSIHTVFRRVFDLDEAADCSCFIYTPGYFKLYINGFMVAFGSGNICCDISDYIMPGENTAALHLQKNTPDDGFCLEIVSGGKSILKSDQSFLFADHEGYSITSTDGKEFAESYDSNAPQIGFELCFFDDTGWQHAEIKGLPYTVGEFTESKLPSPVKPQKVGKQKNGTELDFGSLKHGFLYVPAKGNKGDIIKISCIAEGNHKSLPEVWTLSGGDDEFCLFTEKSVRCVLLEYGSSVTVETEYVRLLVTDQARS